MMQLRAFAFFLLGGVLLSGCDPAGDIAGYEGRRIAEPVLVENQRPLPRLEDIPPDERRRREVEGVYSRRQTLARPSSELSIPKTAVSPPQPVPHRPFEGIVPFNDGTGAPRDPIVRGNIAR